MKKLLLNKRGFSLTEVVIGIMILTVAIVASTNLLTTLRKSNEANLKTMQAYYFAVEGLEMVRNIRDSNWLHNRSLMGNGSAFWGRDFSVNDGFGVSFSGGGFGAALDDGQDLALMRPFDVVAGESEVLFVGGEESVFRREVLFESFENFNPEEAVLVKSVVKFELGGVEREVFVSTVLSNWKDGLF